MTSPCYHCRTETETTQTSEGANDIFKCAICGKLKGVVTAMDKIKMVKKPCPFKFAWGDPNSKICKLLVSQFTGPTYDMSCVGEQNCPIYNGGMK